MTAELVKHPLVVAGEMMVSILGSNQVITKILKVSLADDLSDSQY